MTRAVETQEPAATPEPPKKGATFGASSPAVPAIASGLLLFFAYPPADRGYLAWFAMVPLLTLVRSDRPRWQLYLAGWLGGLAFWVLSLNWIWALHPGAWVAWLSLATYQSLFWPLFLLLARVMVRRQRLPLTFAAPVAWVGLEYVQAHALSGFPWYYLAHSQHRYLVFIQISDLFGAWGVSALVMLANAWLADLISRPLLVPTRRGPRPAGALVARTIVFGLAMAGTLGYGAYRLATADFRPGPTVALLQSNIKQEMKSKADPSEILAIYAGLVSEAVKSGRKLDLVVWPETSFPQGHVHVEPGLPEAELERQARTFFDEADAAFWRRRREYVSKTLGSWATEVGAPMLVGSLLYDFKASGPARTNAAVVFEPDGGDARIYRKIHLVPFGEYVPLVESLPWIARLTPYDKGSLPSLAAGSGPEWLDVGAYRYAVGICFEDTVPHLIRRSFAEAPEGRQPDVLVDLSNDGWFDGTAEHDMHLAISVFRAVEGRAPLIRAVNSGYSAVVDGNGRVVRSLAKLTAGALVETVPLDPRTTLYTRWGDWLAQSAFAMGLGLMIVAAVGLPRPRASRTT